MSLRFKLHPTDLPRVTAIFRTRFHAELSKFHFPPLRAEAIIYNLKFSAPVGAQF